MTIAKLASWLPPADKGQSHAATIIVGSTLLVAVHKYFGSMEFAEKTGLSAISPLFFLFVSTFVLLGVLPALYVKFGLHESLRNYGLQLGDWKAGLASLVVLYPIIALTLLYPGSLTDGLQNQYPLDRTAGTSVGHFLSYELVRGALFYTAWDSCCSNSGNTWGIGLRSLFRSFHQDSGISGTPFQKRSHRFWEESCSP
ncbi:MAG: hypothetical protein HW407_1722 [Bacteroidetes bacterium]|nr:hypothetical protein [Bacteroidota bacterium]